MALKRFGASSHRYQLGAPLSGAEVAQFEAAHRVRLPEAYRAFITTVGHGGPGRYGGAGPYYGLLPLQRWDEALWQPRAEGVLAAPFRVDPGRSYQDWWPEVGLGEDDEPYTGVVALSECGCGIMVVLVVTGPGRGRVAFTAEFDEAPQYSHDDFLTWYEHWLDIVNPRDHIS
ncbi:hypothetical protein GCM10010201_21150 [Pilimelia columellifera subsp. columellifera]|uniref:Knr4/Smi1-like domain-containing protein n=1 Tax=Pilimelia columellifera subsp. columellifera TaxID=706583 RepID=A0ABP6AT57_9ACTN